MPEVTGVDEAARRLRAFGRQFPGRVQRRGLRVVAKLAKRQTVKRLRKTKMGPDGKRWAPWSKAYAATRRAGDSLLIDRSTGDGEMAKSLRVEKDGKDLLMGSRLFRARVHQEGLGNHERPFLGTNEADEAEQQTALDAWAREELDRLGLS